MSDLNVCCFTGRLGKDAESRYMPSGEAVTSFSVAVGSSWKDKNGEKQEATSWVSVSSFGKLAEICGEYLKKGSRVAISGRMEERKYQTKEGDERRVWELKLEKMTMLDTKADSESRGGRDEGSNQSQARGRDTQKPKAASSQNDLDDDIPF